MTNLPGKASGGGHIYLLEYPDDGRIKVGCTTHPRARIKTLRAEGRKYGMPTGRAWVSVPHKNYRANETAMIKWLSRRGEVSGGNEHFTGVDYEEAKSQARLLTFEGSLETLEDHQSTWDWVGSVVDRLPLTAQALLGEVVRGNLFIMDHEGNNVSSQWTGVPSPDLIFDGLIGRSDTKP